MVREFRKTVDHDVDRGVGCGIGRAGGSSLVGSAHKGGAIADAAGRVEVEIVARDLRVYKPLPDAYRRAASFLTVEPHEILMASRMGLRRPNRCRCGARHRQSTTG